MDCLELDLPEPCLYAEGAPLAPVNPDSVRVGRFASGGQDLVDGKTQLRKRERPDHLATVMPFDVGECMVPRRPEHMDLVLLKIDDPALRDPGPGMQGHFHLPVEGEGRVRDLDDQQRIRGLRVSVRVAPGPEPDDRDVGLGLGVIVQAHGIPNAHRACISDSSNEEPRQAIHAVGVAAPDRGHPHDLPLDELDTLRGVEDPGFGHSVIFFDTEATGRERGGHVPVSAHRAVGRVARSRA